mmetsp:Transcript_56542/g.89795  ORF Transcript_56542/g.89795 Transcript_56542/m.89795 type:complete len:119 (+) Transcript_56542:92-448(+)|eukprot:CAMPEP_0169125436 /NCGR_PEP_ID=MMETSP1015-20121227/34880_1 /TAXON_ID=342587 /ORGANISM="Karlodinium micrum, Strain CCMP2283" /LENGTH=118 /DNA_ID=CAMNT_0009188965 /DNA_START=79 /DNA_END=435 /DNA_ORIENTATION=-
MYFLRIVMPILLGASWLTISDARAVNLLRVHGTRKAAGIESSGDSSHANDDRYAEACGSKLIGQVDDVMEDIEAERGVPPEPDDGDEEHKQTHEQLAARASNDRRNGVFNYITGSYAA